MYIMKRINVLLISYQYMINIAIIDLWVKASFPVAGDGWGFCVSL